MGKEGWEGEISSSSHRHQAEEEQTAGYGVIEGQRSKQVKAGMVEAKVVAGSRWAWGIVEKGKVTTTALLEGCNHQGMGEGTGRLQRNGNIASCPPWEGGWGQA